MIDFLSQTDPQVDSSRIHTIVESIQADPMGGWFDLPENFAVEDLKRLKATAAKIQANSDYLVCIGIGGSYLGHRALIEALRPQSRTQILYAGNSLSTIELEKLLETLDEADFSINVISKSGTTTEPAVAFRLLKAKLYQKYGDRAAERIYATTDAAKGALYTESVARDYERFVVPDNIGGRYSVLTPVGLLPLAIAGVDLDELLAGAAAERKTFLDANLATSPIARYATFRTNLLRRGYDVEVLACFEPCFRYFSEWWKQLFGESEGKAGQGIFPASVIYTTDLHSLGQYLQDGRRNIFETMLRFERAPSSAITVPEAAENLDGLAYLEGKTLDFLNSKALEATIVAHRDGGIPVSEVVVPDITARSMGALVFFFETVCAISAELVGINPFDQPGVEAYKRNMFHLLGKPGF